MRTEDRIMRAEDLRDFMGIEVLYTNDHGDELNIDSVVNLLFYHSKLNKLSLDAFRRVVLLGLVPPLYADDTLFDIVERGAKIVMESYDK